MTDNTIAGYDCCPGHTIDPLSPEPSGMVFGRCSGCGDDTFVISDPGYEEWLASDEAVKCGTFRDLPPMPLWRRALWTTTLPLKGWWWRRTFRRLAREVREGK